MSSSLWLLFEFIFGNNNTHDNTTNNIHNNKTNEEDEEEEAEAHTCPENENVSELPASLLSPSTSQNPATQQYHHQRHFNHLDFSISSTHPLMLFNVLHSLYHDSFTSSISALSQQVINHNGDPTLLTTTTLPGTAPLPLPPPPQHAPYDTWYQYWKIVQGMIRAGWSRHFVNTFLARGPPYPILHAIRVCQDDPFGEGSLAGETLGAPVSQHQFRRPPHMTSSVNLRSFLLFLGREDLLHSQPSSTTSLTVDKANRTQHISTTLGLFGGPFIPVMRPIHTTAVALHQLCGRVLSPAAIYTCLTMGEWGWSTPGQHVAGPEGLLSLCNTCFVVPNRCRFPQIIPLVRML